MQKQNAHPDESATVREARAAAALAALARLLGRQAAREHFAESCSREDENGEEETAG